MGVQNLSVRLELACHKMEVPLTHDGLADAIRVCIRHREAKAHPTDVLQGAILAAGVIAAAGAASPPPVGELPAPIAPPVGPVPKVRCVKCAKLAKPGDQGQNLSCLPQLQPYMACIVCPWI